MNLREAVAAFRERPWKPFGPVQLGAVLSAGAFLFRQLLTDDDGYLPILDDLNLVFHEAGHPIFGLFGATAGLYGGTIGQLVFPAATSVSFWFRREAVGASLCGVWLFENFLNIARYMADARARLLPLVGGGEYDWWHIFRRWGVLAYDTRIAAIVRAVGWIGMIFCVLWLCRRFFRLRNQNAEASPL